MENLERNLRWASNLLADASPTSNTQFLSENVLLLIIVRTGKLNQGQVRFHRP
jgi:hypothetical protein